ncbi:hypothetical protein ACQ4PT_023494 [Festuca glaucescens]
MAIRSLLLPLAVVAVLAASSAAVAQLEIGFYSKTCPQVEEIVREEMIKIIAAAPSLAGPLLRLHFHDCFVRGCDASVLLDSTKGNVAEKDAKPNKSLRGFGSMERVKAKLEAACPGVVSCADVLTLMSRDAVIFASKDLNLKDLVVLSGAHTLGTAHCPSYADRLYNATGTDGAYGLVDTSLDSEYADKLRLKCKSLDDRSMLSEMDPGSYKTFDSSYYGHVAKRRGLFRSDAALLTDATTSEYVQRVATGKFDAEFFKDFSESMIKMGNVGVLTGPRGRSGRSATSSTSVLDFFLFEITLIIHCKL